MDAKLLCERMAKVFERDCNGYISGTHRMSKTRRIESEFIRRRVEGALRRSLDGCVSISIMLHEGLKIPFRNMFGESEEYDYLGCDKNTLYVVTTKIVDDGEECDDGIMVMLPCMLPLPIVKYMVFHWTEEKDAYTTGEIAEILGITCEEVEERALHEGWKSRERRVRGA